MFRAQGFNCLHNLKARCLVLVAWGLGVGLSYVSWGKLGMSSEAWKLLLGFRV